MMRTLATASSALAFASVFAQLEIRPHVGLNFQNLTDPPPLSSFKSDAGYHFGASLMLGSRVYMQAGAQYMATNTLFESSLLGQSFSATINSGNLRIPVQLGYRLVHPEDEPTVNMRLFAGFAGNFPLSVTVNETGGSQINAGTGHFAVGGGVGLDILIFFLDVGYDVGLNPVFDTNSFITDPRANLLHVSAGVRLKFAR